MKTIKIEQIINHILPEKRLRENCLNSFSECIIFADELGSSKWGIRLLKDRVRLLVGSIIVCTINDGEIWIALDQAKLNSNEEFNKILNESPFWRWDKQSFSEYSRVPSKNGYYHPTDKNLQLWQTIKTVNFEYIRKVASKFEKLQIRSQEKHDSELLNYIEEELGISLPHPDYAGPSSVEHDFDGQEISESMDYTKLESYFQLFKEYVEEKSGEPFNSFNSNSWLDKEENYKKKLRTIARDRLDITSWEQEDIGTGKIVHNTINAIEIDEEDFDNNLLWWRPRRGEGSQTHYSLLQARDEGKNLSDYEQLLFDFYKSRISDKEAMGKFIELAGKKYGLMAYLFYIKDDGLYLPIATRTFDTAFELIGVDLTTSRRCSWGNYQKYNQVIEQVRQYLSQKLPSEVKLIDAHSFLFIIVGKDDFPDSEVSEELMVNVLDPDLSQISDSKKEEIKGNFFITESKRKKKEENQRKRGRRVEGIVYKAEVRRLKKAGREDLADEVKNVSKTHGHGYDIQSYNIDGSDRFIEVKSAAINGSSCQFYLTRNEYNTFKDTDSYYFYLVDLDEENRSKIYRIPAKSLSKDKYDIKPTNYSMRVEFG